MHTFATHQLVLPDAVHHYFLNDTLRAIYHSGIHIFALSSSDAFHAVSKIEANRPLKAFLQSVKRC